MLKTLAIVRSAMLVFVLFLMTRAQLLPVDPSLVCDEQRLYYFHSAKALLTASVVAVGWLALEAGVTWWRALRRPRKPASSAAAPTGP